MKTLKFERLTILLHVLAWAILFFFPFFGRDTFSLHFIIKSAFHIAVLASFFYLNMFILIPNYLFQKKIGIYVCTVLIGIVLVMCIYLLFDQWWMEISDNYTALKPNRSRLSSPGRQRTPRSIGFRMIFPLISSLMVFGISTSLRTINEYLKKEKLQKETANEKLNSELAFLKSQINPHFLFNTLNNLYSLAHSRSSNTANAIMKLSELMRYMLEDTAGKKMQLYRELEYIKNYLELQRLRIDESVKVELLIEGDFTNKTIEPLLLIPFIENAFKHGISYQENSFIRVELISNDHQLILKVENSVSSQKAEKDDVSGIGLKNVRKRLELLYAGMHHLTIQQNENRYFVNLIIDL
ncbi:MAG TPA: histidine kinase [Cytophagaceae bacterium]|jgi:two-component system LytT family sensor kinase|nr:histidine kinase [Cytophagaceae bacterium]